MSMKLEIVHVDTCLPDYWGGHHKAHVCVPVWKGMTFDELKSSIRGEFSQGAVCGSDYIFDLLSGLGDFSDDCVESAIERMELTESADPNNLFSHLEDDTDDGVFYDPVQAYFLIVESDC